MAQIGLRQSLLLRAAEALCLLAVAVGSLAVAKAVALLATCLLEAAGRRLHQITKHNSMPKKASPLARGLRTPLIDGSLDLQMYVACAWFEWTRFLRRAPRRRGAGCRQSELAAAGCRQSGLAAAGCLRSCKHAISLGKESTLGNTPDQKGLGNHIVRKRV